MTSETTSVDQLTAMQYRSDRDELRQLRPNRAQLVQLMDSLPGLVGYVDLDLKIVYANRLTEVWYQQPLTELVGMHLKTLFTEEHYKTV